MATKLTAVLMLALLVLPSCCCLQKGNPKDSKKEECGSCCEEVASAVPASNLPNTPPANESDPCDCVMVVAQVMGLPEVGFTKADQVEQVYSMEWIGIENPFFSRTDENTKSLIRLTSFQPQSRRSCQEYCVYLI